MFSQCSGGKGRNRTDSGGLFRNSQSHWIYLQNLILLSILILPSQLSLALQRSLFSSDDMINICKLSAVPVTCPVTLVPFDNLNLWWRKKTVKLFMAVLFTLLFSPSLLHVVFLTSAAQMAHRHTYFLYF